MRSRLRSITKYLSRHELGQWEKILSPLSRDLSILEVGCGRGTKTDFLRSIGFTDILGVEKNEHQVRECRDRGLNVVSLSDFDSNHGDERFDLLILSHIVEHFDSGSVVDFIDGYLKFLRPGGLLLVATPILHPHFWHDLDHCKPYYPQGIRNFYSGAGQQVGYFSQYCLKLKDIRYRRSPFRIKNSRSLLLKKNDLPVLLFNAASAALARLSFHLIGYKSGWVGLYKLK